MTSGGDMATYNVCGPVVELIEAESEAEARATFLRRYDVPYPEQVNAFESDLATDGS
jgi:hypothetical protein